MTEPTDSTPSADHLDRIARLQARRAAGHSSTAASTNTPSGPTIDETIEIRPARPKPTARRRHAALGSRIAAAGLGATSMFAIVGLLGLQDQSDAAADSTPTEPPPVAERPIQIVVHHIPAATPAPTPTTAPDAVATTPTGPIELTANTVVRTITVTEAPRNRGGGGGNSSGGGNAAPAPAPAPKPASNASSGGSK